MLFYYFSQIPLLLSVREPVFDFTVRSENRHLCDRDHSRDIPFRFGSPPLSQRLCSYRYGTQSRNLSRGRPLPLDPPGIRLRSTEVRRPVPGFNRPQDLVSLKSSRPSPPESESFLRVTAPPLGSCYLTRNTSSSDGH